MAPTPDTWPAGAEHAFEHGVDPGRPGQRRALGWALGVNAALLVVEIAGGIIFGSLALLADAAHLVSDVAGLGIAVGALTLMARPISGAHSFGLARAEVMAAQVSALLLVGSGVWIIVAGVARLHEPVNVSSGGLVAVAALGLLVNAGSAVVVHRARGKSLNMRASVAHLATDAAGSLAAILAGVAIWAWGWLAADAVASLATAVLVLWAGWGLIRESTHVLMEGTPRGLEPSAVRAAICQVAGVVDVHHLHLWNLASDVPTCSAHIVLAGQPSLHAAQAVAAQVRGELAAQFSLTHVTLELEERTTAEPPAPAT